ncbi:unnamed protein product [Prunus armeniaca]|uniref:Uncharacterized protein n=1 Tax=Prunus armeniaca TaxID=36596 RepID=A0A6J5Y5T4_PRUAR|nr:unnamed protein product [Prunus armeniaca]
MNQTGPWCFRFALQQQMPIKSVMAPCGATNWFVVGGHVAYLLQATLMAEVVRRRPSAGMVIGD